MNLETTVGPVVKKLSCSAGPGLITGGELVPHAVEQLSLVHN